MAASDVYVRVHIVCFGPDPHRDVIDFMQRPRLECPAGHRLPPRWRKTGVAAD